MKNCVRSFICLLALTFTIWKIVQGLSRYPEPRVKFNADNQHYTNSTDKPDHLPPKYHTVYPYLSDKRGRRIGPLKQCQLSINRKPNVIKKQEFRTSNRFYATIRLPTEKLVLKLRLNKRLTLNRPQVHFFDESGRPQRTFISDSCHYIGKVLNRNNSSVSLSSARGSLTGLIRTSTTDYLIEPMSDKHSTRSNQIPHMIYKVETALTWKNCSTSGDKPYGKMKTKVKRETSQFDYYNGFLLNDSARIYLETLVAIDEGVVKFHGSNSSAIEYIMTIMNIVSVIYEDSALNANLQIVVSKILFVNKFNTSIVKWNDEVGLENVCKLSPTYRDDDDDDVDIKIYLTRDDIGGVAGFAPLRSICDSTSSCLVIRDEGLTSAFVLAHEIAHVLGLSHDGDRVHGNNCLLDKNQHSIMAPTVQSNFNRYYWSDCSISQFHNQRKLWFCLENKPKRNDKTPLNIKSLNGTLYNLDDQCRQEFGQGYRHCKQYKNMDPCQILWCTSHTKKTVCLTKQKSPLNGTPCSADKCCKNGQCVGKCKGKHPIKPIYQNPLHGKWGNWGSFGACSRKCGGGVQFRSRKCNNPSPTHGGRYCVGPREDFQLCNQNKCPETKDYREEQCKIYAKYHSDISSQGFRNTWVPTPTNGSSSDCKLSCTSTKINKTFVGENVKDGTLCSYDGSHNMCVQGTCQRVGCDGVLNSTARLNSCGICNKNNSYCKVTEKMYFKIPTKRFTRVAVVPRHARHLMIRKAVGAPNFIVLQSRKLRQFVLNGGKDQETSKLFVATGTIFNYTVDNGTEVITAEGPILEELLVLVSIKRWKTPVKIFTNYTMPKNKSLDSLVNSEDYYYWKEMGFSKCSKPCGGGIQILKTKCNDRRHGKAVSKRHCTLSTKPIIRKRKCNDSPCVYK
ncbi:ADAM metallopeptidase with thrombospondin type 1 motif, variant 2 [Chamberlinius hualienensis]